MAGELLKAGDILKIGQRVEFYVGEDEEKYPSRIEGHTGKELLVAMPLTRQRVPVIPEKSSTVYGLAIGDQCRYRFFATFLGSGWTDGRIPVWRLAMPEHVEKYQNREFVRVKVSQRMHVNIIDEEGCIGEPIATWSLDFSGSGISFPLWQEVVEGTRIALDIHDIPEMGTVNVMSQVVRCVRQEDPDGRTYYHVGVRFMDLPRPTVNKLVKYLFAVQRRALAKGISL